MVGSYWDGSTSHGFLYNGRTFTEIKYPRVDYTEPFGINDKGDIVGFYWDGSATHGFLFVDGGFKTLDMPGALATQPYGINDKGQIVGGYYDGDKDGGFLYEQGGFRGFALPSYGVNNNGKIARDTIIAFPQGYAGWITRINNRGHVVGCIYAGN